MRLFELSNNLIPVHPLVKEFWESLDDYTLRFCLVQNNCQSASQELLKFLEDNKGIMNAEVVRIGQMVNGKKKYGWFETDVPDTDIEALTDDDVTAMQEQNLNPKSQQDRITYITQNNLQDEFRMVPHSWVEVRGEILDPSAFYLDGKSGQFDTLVKDRTNIPSRYNYF